MTTPASFNLQALDYSRLLLLDKVTRAPYGLALYPLANLGTRLLVNITATSINLRYVSNGITTTNVSYENKTIEQLAIEINGLSLPIKAQALCKDTVLSSGDLLSYDTSAFVAIPEGFRVHDRLSDSGIVIRTKKYSVKHRNIANFRVLSPYYQSVLLPWYPLITNGQFVQKYREKIYHYGIPEYESQTWSIRYGKPFKDVIGGSLKRLSQNSYKVSRTPIFWNGENINIYRNDVPISNSIIEDIDTHNGIIYFNDTKGLDEITNIDYTYLENNYEYKGININSHFSQNASVLDKFVLLYAKPMEGSDYQRNKKTIYHVVSSSIEEAIASIEAQNVDIPTVIIGGYSVNQVMTSDRVQILDTRSLGGGLISNDGPLSPTQSFRYESPYGTKSKDTPIEDQYNESASFWDIGNWDGEIYPGAAAVAISLPESIRESLSKQDIVDRAAKFMAAGVYPVVDYYKDRLPAVSGRSSQISLLMNGSLIESIPDQSGIAISGVAWLRRDFEVPGSTFTGDWPDEISHSPVTYKAENTGIMWANPQPYQSYLKSTPVAGIEYYYRDLTIITGSKDDTILYSPWKRTVIEDRRPVPNGWLTKGFLDFTHFVNATEIKSVKVNSPFRLDTTGVFKNHIETELQKITQAISGRTEEFSMRGIDGSEISVIPITYNYKDLESETLAIYGDYNGAGRGYNYLFSMVDTNLENGYSGLIDRVGKQVAASFSGVGSRIYPRFYSNGNGYQSYFDQSTTGVDFREVLEQASVYASWKGRTAGYTDPVYTGIQTALVNFVGHLTGMAYTGYFPRTYIVNDPTGTIDFGPQDHFYPTGSGYTEAEVVLTKNSDAFYLYMNPAICSTAMAFRNHLSPQISTISSMMSLAKDTADMALARSSAALTGIRTYSGNPVVQSWYMPYNRYGKYLGSLTRQLISSYDYIYRSQIGATGVTYDALSGMDVSTLDWYFSGIQGLLYNAYDGVAETILRNGVMEPGLADTLYGYGWYVANRSGHIAYRDQYNDLTGAGADYTNKFEGLFTTGLYSLVKGMTTTNASMLEATVVNGETGPFNPFIPSKIFDTLSIGCDINRSKFLPLAQAVFNTITGNYSVNGIYWLDPLKSNQNGGYEDVVAPYFVRLYEAIDG